MKRKRPTTEKRRRMGARVRSVLLGFVTALLALSALTLPVCASEPDSVEKFTDELVARLPSLVRERIPDEIDGESVRELFGAEHLMSLLVSEVREGGSGFVRELLRLCGLVFISASAMLVGRQMKNSRNATLIESAVLVISASSVFSMMQGSLDRAFAYLRDLLEISTGMIPIMSGLYLAGGSNATAGVSGAVLSASSAVIENICISGLGPVVYVCFGFSAVTALGGNIDTSGIAKTVRNCYITLVTLSCVILTAMLSFQSAIAASADSLTARTVKFAVGRLVPIVGGSVGDSLRTVGASLALIKSTLGAASVFALIAVALPPLVSLLLGRLMLNISASVATLLGCPRVRKLLEELRGIYDVMSAVVAASSVQFVIILTVFIQTSVAIA